MASWLIVWRSYPETKSSLIPSIRRDHLHYVTQPVTRGLKAIYQVPTVVPMVQALDAFSGTWDSRYPHKPELAGNPGGLTKMGDITEGQANGNEPFYYRVR